MGAKSTQISISIRVGNESFSISGMRLLNGRYKVKIGRSWSVKIPDESITGIFDIARRWAVARLKELE